MRHPWLPVRAGEAELTGEGVGCDVAAHKHQVGELDGCGRHLHLDAPPWRADAARGQRGVRGRGVENSSTGGVVSGWCAAAITGDRADGGWQSGHGGAPGSARALSWRTCPPWQSLPLLVLPRPALTSRPASASTRRSAWWRPGPWGRARCRRRQRPCRRGRRNVRHGGGGCVAPPRAQVWVVVDVAGVLSQ